MPNIKSAQKRVKVSDLRQKNNQSKRSKLRNSIRNTVAAIAEKDLSSAKQNLTQMVINLDKAATKGLIHKNKAARHKSRLMKKINSL